MSHIIKRFLSVLSSEIRLYLCFHETVWACQKRFVIVQPAVNLSEFFCYLVCGFFSLFSTGFTRIKCIFIMFYMWFTLIFLKMNLFTLKPPVPPPHYTNFFSHLQTSSLLNELSVICKQLLSYIKILKPILEARHYLYLPALVKSRSSFSCLQDPAQFCVLRPYIIVPAFSGLLSCQVATICFVLLAFKLCYFLKR